MNVESQLLARLIGVASPWEVTRFTLDQTSKRMDVWVALESPKGWFGFGRKPAARETREHVWRHRNLWDYSTMLHVAVPTDSEPARIDWHGEVGMPFTHGMARRVVMMFSDGIKPATICKLLDIGPDEMWKYKFALDQGKASAGSSTEQSASGPSTVPEAGDPIWEMLADGSLNIDVRVLGLKLLLTRVRNQVKVIYDTDVLAMKYRELHRFFVKNERSLAHEIEQLKSNAVGVAGAQ